MPNIFTRIFGFPILLDRLADKDAQIVSLKVEIQELRDRLFQRHGLAPSGEQVQQPHVAVPAYLTGRQRLRRLVEQPLVSAELSEDDEAQIRGSLTQ